MKNKLIRYLLVVSGVFIMSTAWSQNKWIVDPVHSNILFSVTHLMISEVEGSFTGFSGTITSSTEEFAGAVIDFRVDVNSIGTGNEMRDDHLKGEDFFNVEKYPEIIFQSTSFTKIDENRYKLTGDLTMHGVTKKMNFDVEYKGTVKDPYGNTKAGFKVSSGINRFDYGLKWNALTEAGNAVVSQEVKIELNLQFTLQK